MIENFQKISDKIISFYQQGDDYQSIFKKICEFFDQSAKFLKPRFVRDVIYRYHKKLTRNETHRIDKRRKKKLTKTICVLIKHLTEKSNGFITGREIHFYIRRLLKKKIAVSTINIFRHHQGYNFRRSRSKPKVFTDEEKIIRHLFALNNIDKDFKNIVFVDECSIQTKRRGIYHNRKKSSRPLVATEKPRSVETVHVWGGISYYGTTKFVTFTTTLTEDGYKILIDKYLSPFIEAYPGDCTLFQDNASTHNSAASLQALHDNNIKFIKIPAYSPDINIIELVWSELKHYVRKKYCKDIKSITERINKFFQNHFTLEKCRDYVGRVKKVLPIIIEKEGDWSNC